MSSRISFTNLKFTMQEETLDCTVKMIPLTDTYGVGRTDSTVWFGNVSSYEYADNS